MKILRCSVVVVAASCFFSVLATSPVCEAAPITYSFSGVLGDCSTPFIPGTCFNDLSGATIFGSFTTDETVSTLLAASFSVSGADPALWRIRVPDPTPNQVVSMVTPTNIFIQETLILPFPEFERFIVNLNFNNPLTSSSGSTLNTAPGPPLVASGIVRQGALSISNPFVSGAANVVPEPSSLLLLSTGVMGFVARRRLFPSVT